MTGVREDALRVLAREIAARCRAQTGAVVESRAEAAVVVFAGHARHQQFLTLPAAAGPCLIEPDVACPHGGYCQSYGH